jgi:hypothetical protein
MEIVNFNGWPNCIKLKNNQAELIVTTDVGPRIISFGYIGGQNLLYVSQEDKGKRGGDEWRNYGGHRLWHSPEVAPRTYCPDNTSVSYSWNGKKLKLTQDIEPSTGIIKELEITLNTDHRSLITDHSVSILHRLINKNQWDIQLAPWAITALAPGGRAILPQEPFIDPADYLLPSRPLVLWHYTRMNDPRWIWGDRYIQLKYDPAITSEQKLGLLNKQKWGAYLLNGELFIKTFEYDPQAEWSDFGCNNEIWVNGTFLELESLGPFAVIPAGGSAEHTEQWLLARADMDESEDSIDRNILPLVQIRTETL